jgi:two-component system, NarL family, sensor kinase
VGLHTRRAELVLVAALVSVLLGTSFISLAAASGNYTDPYILKPEAREELITFVNEARDFVLAEGRDKALQVFNDPKGMFTRGEFYITAHSFNATLLANPYAPELVDQNVLNRTDPNGIAHARIIQGVDRCGGGFAYYVWPNPAHSNAEELKLAYDLKVDDGLWLLSSIYLPGPAPIFSNESREDLKAFVKSARDYALNHTREEALKAFNDINGEFVIGNRYIYAYDIKGNTLAMPCEPDEVGTNCIDLQDPNGVYPIQRLLDADMNGDGFTYTICNDSAENMTYMPKLDYVMKVNDEWFLGSGIY